MKSHQLEAHKPFLLPDIFYLTHMMYIILTKLNLLSHFLN